MFHLIDRFCVLMIPQFAKTPVFVDSGVKKILIDRGQFVPEHAVQMFYNRCVAFH
jgi:hypothetical protein